MLFNILYNFYWTLYQIYNIKLFGKSILIFDFINRFNFIDIYFYFNDLYYKKMNKKEQTYVIYKAAEFYAVFILRNIS
jgi:hypothetical protein